MAKTVVSGSYPKPGQLKDLFRQFADGSLTEFHLDALLNHRNPFEIPSELIEQWKLFYCTFFHREIDLEGLQIPKPQGDITKLVIIPKGLTYDEVERVMWQLFPCWKYTDKKLSEVIDLSYEARTPDTTYAIRVRDNIEADEFHKNKSANNIAGEGIHGITLLERLVLEIHFWWLSDKKKHLDFENVTLCTGSRYLSGNVPSVCFSLNNFVWRVGWSYPSSMSDNLRVREVVC